MITTLVQFRSEVLLNAGICLTLLTIMLTISHSIGDWFLQTEYQALNKSRGKCLNRAILTHCANYTLCYVPTLLMFDMNLLWLGLIFFSHLFIDRRTPVIWIRKHIAGNSDESINATFWITVVMDQILHLLINVIVIFAKAYELTMVS